MMAFFSPESLAKIRNYFNRSPVHKLSWQPFLSFYEDDCFTLAAAISFYFLLSFIPFIILLGSVLGFVIKYVQTIYQVTPSELATMVMQYITVIVPYVQKDLIEQFFSISDYRTSLGWIGFSSLLISATLLFSTLHYSFFRIFGGKFINIILSRMMGVLFIITLSLLIFFTHYLLTLVYSLSSLIEHYIPYARIIFDFLTYNGALLSFLITTGVLMLLFKIMLLFFTRDVYIRKWSIFSGALFFAICWNGARILYSFYITKLSTMSVIYGSLTWLVTIVLWIYYSTLILLLSMELIKSINTLFPKVSDS